MSTEKEILEDIRDDVEEIRSRQGQALEGWKYSIQRMDLLIISISGAGVYVILETLKQAFTEIHLCNIWVLKLSGVFFIGTIIINFVSQWTGMQANKNEILYCDEKLAKNYRQKEANRYDCLTRIYTNWTYGLNLTSMITMFVGLIIIALYFLMTF